ncbi:M28 family peptidase [Luteolibacter sp. AS25]|uniref:M28 family peptidase n=1 Tax=Luteolibacter sp. AS25 TaxID=3135776 RepID=UPI00398B94B9
MKTRLILAVLALLAATAAFWFLRSDGDSSKLGIEAKTLTDEILAFGPRPPASENLRKVQQHLSEGLEKAGWVTNIQEFERSTPIGNVRFRNLRARFGDDGTKTWNRNITGILCAHLDSKYDKEEKFLGADDAASACAALVEIGKYLAEYKPEQAGQLEIVFFDGEEAFAKNMTILDGLYGSRFYANQWRTQKVKPDFGILLDMVGHEDLSIRIPSDSPENLAKLMFETARENSVSHHFGTAPGPIMDDHLPLNLVGIPTLDIIGDFANKRWWHTPGDNAAIVSAESLGISIGVTLGMLDELLKQ